MLAGHLKDRKGGNPMKGISNRWLNYPLLVLVVSGFWGCSKSFQTPTAPTDASITDTLKASLASDPQLSSERLAVTVNNGEVTLSGEVSSDAAHLQAYKLANETPGVKKVNDLIQVRSAVVSAPPPEEPPVSSPKPVAHSKPPT